MTCSCGLPAYRKANRDVCRGCDLSPRWCRCIPVPVVPEWLRRAREGRGLAKDLTERAA